MGSFDPDVCFARLSVKYVLLNVRHSLPQTKIANAEAPPDQRHRAHFWSLLSRTPFTAPLSLRADATYIFDMFGEFLKKLTAAAPDALDDTDARLAMTSLLVRVARTDGDYDATEARQIETVVGARYGLDETAAAALRTQAEVLEAEAPDTVRFTKAIKTAVPYEEREGVIEALWSVVLADGTRDHEEDALLRLVANLLGVSDRDSALARKRVRDATS